MNTKKSLFLAALLASATAALAQPALLYKKAFGGTWYDYASEVKATPDSGMIIIGTTMSSNGDITTWNHNSVDAFVVKLSTSGTLDWKKTYGGTGYDAGNRITPTSDGGYIIGGTTESNDYDVPAANDINSMNLWILKIDAAGNVQWKKTYGGSNIEMLNTLLQLSDGSYVVGGSTRSADGDVSSNHGLDDCWVLRLDATGNLQWQKTYGGSSYDQFSQLILTSDGGFAFTALTYSNDGDVSGIHAGYDIWMVKLDAAGTIQWSRCYGGSAFEYSAGLLQTPAGGYVLLGTYSGNYPSTDGDGAFTDTTGVGGCWVVKITSTGNLVWEKQYGGSTNEWSAAISSDASGRYVIAASSYSNDGNVTGHHGPTSKNDYWVFCLDTTGALSWEKSFGGTDNEDAASVCLLNDGNLAVLGNTSSNNNGDVQNSGYHFGTETINPPNSPSFTVNTNDYWVIKITSPPGNPAGVNEQVTDADFVLAPNPASADFTIAAEGITGVRVNDLAGRLVYNERSNNLSRQTINIDGWNAGIYLVTVRTTTGTATKKLVVSAQ